MAYHITLPHITSYQNKSDVSFSGQAMIIVPSRLCLYLKHAATSFQMAVSPKTKVFIGKIPAQCQKKVNKLQTRTQAFIISVNSVPVVAPNETLL